MEYIYKNSKTESVYNLTLNENNLTIKTAKVTTIIPYACITAIRLMKVNNCYKLILNSENHQAITITNLYYVEENKSEDLSRQYTAFVRVLHYHLKVKSHATYTTGHSLNNILVWSLVAAFFSFFISFISEYMSWSVMNSFLQAIILTSLLVIAIISININHLPSTYRPEDIPPLFLPDFWK